MTWERIEYFPDCEGHLLDGYLPAKELIKRLQLRYRHMKTGEGFGLLRGFDQTPDAAYLELADAIARSELQSLAHRPDPWYVALLKPSQVARGPPYAALAHESSADTSDNHRGLVVLTGLWPQSECYIERLIKQAHFQPKAESEYQDYEAFKGTCEKMLEDLLDVFVTPMELAQKRLESAGLGVYGLIE